MRGFRRPKKSHDQPAFRTSWAAKRANGTTKSPASHHTSHAAMAMRKYRTDQIVPMVRPDGAQEGLRRPTYQDDRDRNVNRDPT